MRILRIFLLNFQNVFEYRSRSFVWFVIGLIGPLVMILFWYAASNSNSDLQFSTIASYYLLLIPISITLTSHVEEKVSNEDIKDGELTHYLMRPFSYYWFNYFEEVPYRLLQGFYGIVIVGILLYFFPYLLTIKQNPFSLLLAICIFILGYALSFTFKMIVGLVTFWVTDIGGFIQFEDMLFFIFAGYMMPLYLLPTQMQHIAQFLPFAYMIYYPVQAVQGALSVDQLFWTMFLQVCWLLGLVYIYSVLWHNGLKKFTATGQ
jgi:ABC-2 type transport system permease protein